ncbi:MAG TPA: TIGR02996 domain-containing protein [Gemmataceae bacterium]|nr:TIGR02996 domain-containing protein [Gemmataceae bacterium]
MSDTETALLKAIYAQPEEDTPRLVYADWLDEQGTPAQTTRAEFIRLQIEMAPMMPDSHTAPNDWEQPRYRGLEARAIELYNRHSRAWFGNLDRLVDHIDLHRGFPDHIELTVRRFIAKGEEIFRLAPTIRNVFLDKLGRNAAALAKCKALRHVRELVFFETPLWAAEMTALAKSPHLGNLRVFEIPFTDTEIGAEGARALAKAKSITALETLNLFNHRIHNVGAQFLLAAPWSSALRDLNLGGNGLGEYFAELLADADHLSGLRNLDLMNNYIGSHGAEVLSRSAILTGLEELSLMNNPIGDVGARALAESRHLRCLRRLDLARCNLTDEGCAAVAAGGWDLESLRLVGNTVGPATIAALAKARHLARLRKLGLWDCEIDPIVAAALGRVAGLARLQDFRVSGNPLEPAGVRALLDGPLVASVTWLDLDRCGIGDDGAAAIARSPTVANLRILHLRSNRITVKGAKALARSRHLANLQSLHIRENRIGREGRAVLKRRFGKDRCHF